jgi:hypothetical protein
MVFRVSELDVHAVGIEEQYGPDAPLWRTRPSPLRRSTNLLYQRVCIALSQIDIAIRMRSTKRLQRSIAPLMLFNENKTVKSRRCLKCD